MVVILSENRCHEGRILLTGGSTRTLHVYWPILVNFDVRDLHLILDICESGENRPRDWP
jgi:hypothetical protein